MEKISRNNYETFFLDYLEGNLDPLKTEELYSFLLLHPDLKNELDEFEMITLDSNNKSYENKTILKKFDFTGKVREFNFEQYCVAFFEGDLNKAQSDQLSNFLSSNQDRLKIFEQYRLARLKEDTSIVFFGKDKLKRGSSNTLIILKKLSIAASMLIVAGFSFFLLNREDSKQTNLVAESQNPTEIVLPEKGEISDSSQETFEHTSSNSPNNEFVLTSSLIEIKEGLTEENIQLERISLEPLVTRKPDFGEQPGVNIFFASLGETEKRIYSDSSSENLFASLRENIDEFGSAINTDGIDGSGRLTIWDIADAGINGFSRLTGADVRIDKKKDEQGNVTALAFQSRNLNFTKRINY